MSRDSLGWKFVFSKRQLRSGVGQTVFLSCRVLEGLFEAVAPGVSPIYLDFGLHKVPIRLAGSIQEKLDSLPEPSVVVLGYGLCGNGLVGLRSGRHTIVMPRCDDCISILLGSYQDYLNELETHPGTYYLSRGWIEVGTHPMKEFDEYRAKYGEETARWLIAEMFHNYRRLALVGQNASELARYRVVAEETARFLKMSYVELIGRDTLIRRLVEKSSTLGADEDDLIVLGPGGELTQTMFARPRNDSI